MTFSGKKGPSAIETAINIVITPFVISFHREKLEEIRIYAHEWYDKYKKEHPTHTEEANFEEITDALIDQLNEKFEILQIRSTVGNVNPDYTWRSIGRNENEGYSIMESVPSYRYNNYYSQVEGEQTLTPTTATTFIIKTMDVGSDMVEGGGSSSAAKTANNNSSLDKSSSESLNNHHHNATATLSSEAINKERNHLKKQRRKSFIYKNFPWLMSRRKSKVHSFSHKKKGKRGGQDQILPLPLQLQATTTTTNPVITSDQD